MSYFGKIFVKDLKDLRKAHKDFRIAKECVRASLPRIRDEVSPEAYAILHARINMDIATPPDSMRRIARALKLNGAKETEVSRQRVDQIITNTLKKLSE